MRDIAVIGAGSWGTALSVHLARLGHGVRLWAREAEVVAQIRGERVNGMFLPGIPLPESIAVCESLDEAVAGMDLVVVVTPSHGTRAVLRAAAPHLRPSAVDRQRDEGPRGGHAPARDGSDRARRRGPRIPSSRSRGRASLARWRSSCRRPSAPRRRTAPPPNWCSRSSAGRSFRLYTTDDVVGVEIGAALKNVIAIAAGVVEGLGLGHNAMAGLITRGLAEISRLAHALGGRRETLAGLTGLGDLVLTCTGSLEPQPPVRHRARARAQRAATSSATMTDGGRGREDHRRGAGARRAPRRRTAHRRADGRRARRAHGPARRHRGAMLRPQRVEADGR